jgi:hypothetical protein
MLEGFQQKAEEFARLSRRVQLIKPLPAELAIGVLSA